MMTPEQWRELADKKLQLTHKDKLDDTDIAELGRLNDSLDGHPVTLSFEELIQLDMSAEDWLPQYVQETSWGWAWWADYFDTPLEEYAECLSSEAIEFIRGTLPYPEGWAPEGR